MANNRHHDQSIWRELNWLAVILALLVILLLGVVYFLVAFQPPQILMPEIQGFVLAIIANLIPVFLLFVLSYALLRRIEEIRSRENRDALIQQVASQVQLLLTNEFSSSREQLEQVGHSVQDLRKSIELLQQEMQEYRKLLKDFSKKLPSFQDLIAVGGSHEKVMRRRQPKAANSKSTSTQRHLSSLSEESTDDTN